MSAAELSQITGVQTVAWALLHSLWQGALVALALAGALTLLRRAGARHTAALVALLALPVLPVLTAWQSGDRAAAVVRGGSPEWGARPGRAEAGPAAGRLERLAPFEAGEDRLASGDQPGAADAAPFALPRRAPGSGLQPRGDAAARSASIAEPAAGSQALLSSSIARVRAALQPYLPLLVGVWLAGVLALSLVHLGGLRRVRQVRRSARPAGDVWQAALERLCRRMGIARPVELLETATLAVPAVAGWLRPVLLLPASTLTGLSPQQVEALIAHELAHVRRGDLAVNLLQAAIETLLFYHPAAWWISRVVREERESCCDDLAVAACGDRLVYARALADLEGLRAATLPAGAFGALGADGGTLLARIRRLLAPQTPPRRGNAWLAGLLGLMVCAVAAVALPLFAPVEIRLASIGADSADHANGSDGSATGRADSTDSDDRSGHNDWSEHDSEKSSGHASNASDASEEKDGEDEAARAARAAVRSGSWTLERQEDGDLHLGMKTSWRGGRSHNSFHIEPGDLAGLTTGSDVRFVLRRDAGAFHFAGRFDGRDGGGTFTFEPDPGYARELAALGWTGAEGRQMELATHDLSLAFAREIRDLGYGAEPLDRLVEFRIHGVSPELVRGLAEAGYRQLPAERLVEFRIHGVSPELVRELTAAGYGGLSPDRLVEFRIHGVTPEFVRELAAAGYPGLDAERLVEMRIHGVTPQYVQGLAKAGQRGLDAERLVEMRIHGVTPEYVKELAAAGYHGLDPERLVEMRIHGVDADFVRQAAERGHRDLPVEELIDLRIHGLGRRGR